MNAVDKGDRGQADTVYKLSIRTDDAEVTRRRANPGPMQARPLDAHAPAGSISSAIVRAASAASPAR
jgi:hypothetical protein